MTTETNSVVGDCETQPECQPLTVQSIKDNLYEWLQKKADKYKLQYLLAYADDGVIWGKFDKNYSLTTADQVFKIKHSLVDLRVSTLRQCRIFGEGAEVMLWRIGEDWQNDQSWQARVISDTNCSPKDYISEGQILWGTQPVDEAEEFTLVADGAQGLRHAVPLTKLPFSNDRKKFDRPLRLNVRHYIDYDEDGVARIYLSRLVNLTVA